MTNLADIGYPLAEAWASGQPVIARDTTQNEEIAGPVLRGYTPDGSVSLGYAVEGALTAYVAPYPGPYWYFEWLLGPHPLISLGLRPYQAGGDPPLGNVPVSVVVLGLNEEPNIRRCWVSVAWDDQIADSGSAGGTVPVARSQGAKVVEQLRLFFSTQRERSFRMLLIRHDKRVSWMRMRVNT